MIFDADVIDEFVWRASDAGRVGPEHYATPWTPTGADGVSLPEFVRVLAVDVWTSHDPISLCRPWSGWPGCTNVWSMITR